MQAPQRWLNLQHHSLCFCKGRFKWSRGQGYVLKLDGGVSSSWVAGLPLEVLWQACGIIWEVCQVNLAAKIVGRGAGYQRYSLRWWFPVLLICILFWWFLAYLYADYIVDFFIDLLFSLHNYSLKSKVWCASVFPQAHTAANKVFKVHGVHWVLTTPEHSTQTTAHML